MNHPRWLKKYDRNKFSTLIETVKNTMYIFTLYIYLIYINILIINIYIFNTLLYIYISCIAGVMYIGVRHLTFNYEAKIFLIVVSKKHNSWLFSFYFSFNCSLFRCYCQMSLFLKALNIHYGNSSHCILLHASMSTIHLSLYF